MNNKKDEIVTTFNFGSFSLQPREHCLFKNGEQLRLRPKAFATLYYFVQHPNRLIKKSELMDSIWPDVIVSQNTLSHCIEEVRQVLGDNPRDPLFIETIPRLGYKFLPEVSTNLVHAFPGNSPLVAENSNSPSKSSIGRYFIRTKWLWIVVTLALIVGFFLLRPIPGKHQYSEISMAVLPLVNLSNEDEQDFFVDGMTEELISTLSRIPGIRVIARTSIMKYKGKNHSIAEIAEELNVHKILEGSVRKDGNMLRISLQLIDGQTELAIWSEDFNRELKNIFAVQADIARGVSEAVEIQMLRGDVKSLAKGPTENLDAYILYLKGRHEWNKRSENGFKKSFEFFTEAIELDQNFSLAYSGLADVYSYFAIYKMIPHEQAFSQAKVYIDQALKLDDKLAEGHLSLAVILEGYYWSWDEAEKEYKKAIQLNPNLANAYKEYSEFLAFIGRPEEAIPMAKKAISLDPYSVVTNGNLGITLYRGRHYEQAIDQLQKTIEMAPKDLFLIPHWHLAWAFVQFGMQDNAITYLEHWKEQFPENKDVLVNLAIVYGMAGQVEKAETFLQRIKTWDDEPGSIYHFDQTTALALIYYGLEKRDEAIFWFEKALEKRLPELIAFTSDPLLDPIREDQRFNFLLEKMNLNYSFD